MGLLFKRKYTKLVQIKYSPEAVIALADHLKNKFTIGDLLRLKASAQGVKVVDKPEDADEVYTREWAQNPDNIESLMDV